MKKFLSIALICASLLTVFGIAVSASSANDRAPISSQLSSEQLALIQNTDLYDDSMEGISVKDQTVVIVYNRLFMEYAGLSPDELVKKASASIPPDYLLFESYTRIQTLQKNDGQMSIFVRQTYTPNTLPTYLKDLASSDGKSCTILGKTRTIANVICFDGTASYDGIAVYYMTDTNETFVRYYDSRTSNAAEFTLADYQKYAVAYNNYLTSDEHNYDENGNLLYGDSIPFTQFIQSEELMNAEYHHYGRDYYLQSSEPEFPIETVSTVAAVVLWALVVVLLIIRKKRKGKKTAE